LKADDKTWELYEVGDSGIFRANLTCVVTLQGGFHELHNEPEFKDGLITKAVEWTLKRIDAPRSSWDVEPGTSYLCCSDPSYWHIS
jgi:hypothetical protein